MKKNNTFRKIATAVILSSLSFFSFGQIIFSENFEGTLDGITGLPAGWSETGLSTDGVYSVGTDAEANTGGYWPVPTHTMFAMSNDDVCNCDKSAERLILPVQDLSSYSGAARLYFSAVADTAYGGVFTVEVSTDGGSNWTVINTISITNGSYAWQDLFVGLTSYLGQSNVLISFLYNDEGSWGTGLAIDDVSIVVQPPVTDLGIVSLERLNEYTIIPNSQSKTLNISATVSNVGDVSVPSYSVVSNVYLAPDFTTSLQTYTFNGTDLAAGVSNVINQGLYNPASEGTYVVVSNIIASGDVNTTNDTLFNFIQISANEYARDNGDGAGGNLGGNNNTSEIVLGQVFEITSEIALDSVFFAIAPTVIGGGVTVVVSNVVADVPSTTIIGKSATIAIDQAILDEVTNNGGKLIYSQVTDLSGNPMMLAPGKYLIGVRQEIGSGNMGLFYATGNVTTGTNFYSAAGAAFVDVSTVGFSNTPMIRAYVTSPNITNPVTITSDDADNTMCIGQTITLTSSEATGNQWNLNGAPIAGETNATYAVTTSGSYTTTVGALTSDTIMVTAVDCSDLNENQIAGLSVYPNPTSGVLTVSAADFNGFNAITVKDQVGRNVVNTTKITSNVMTFDLNKLANGTYFVALTGNGAAQIIKVQVAK